MRKPERSPPGTSGPLRNKTRADPSDPQGEKGKPSSSGTAMVAEELTGAENGGGGKFCEVHIGNRLEFQNCPDEQVVALQSFLAKRVFGNFERKVEKVETSRRARGGACPELPCTEEEERRTRAEAQRYESRAPWPIRAGDGQGMGRLACVERLRSHWTRGRSVDQPYEMFAVPFCPYG